MLIILAWLFFMPSSVQAAPKKKFVVVIDAGHGGSDVGALENGVMEKDVNLAVAQKLGALIKKKLKDTEVVYTRDNDTFISLQKRADIANNAKADLFVSIHCNSVDKSNKNRSNVVGATTYVLGRHRDGDNLAVAQRENAVVELDADDSAHFSQFDPNSDESYIIFEMTQKKNLQNSVRFASDVQKEMGAAGRVSRGVQQAGFWVLWSTAMPAALIELDFICNPEQAKFLKSSEGQDKLADAIFNAVKKYESYFRKSLGLAFDETVAEQASTDLVAQATRSGDDSPSVSSAVITEAVELPQATQEAEVRRHRQPSSSTATAAKPSTNSSSHRRRSSSARQAGGSSIEEADITVADEAASDVVLYAMEVSDASADKKSDAPKDSSKSKQAKAKDSKAKESKAKEKEKEKKQRADSKPARRSKDDNSRRRSLRQNLNVVYKILIISSEEPLPTTDADVFKGLTPVGTFRENNMFKYTYGESADKAEMDQLLVDILPLFPDASVIKCLN